MMPLLEKGSCLRILHEIRLKGCGEGLKEEYICTILKEVLEGLKYLHEKNGQIHRCVQLRRPAICPSLFQSLLTVALLMQRPESGQHSAG